MLTNGHTEWGEGLAQYLTVIKVKAFPFLTLRLALYDLSGGGQEP